MRCRIAVATPSSTGTTWRAISLRREVITSYLPLPDDLEFEDWYINIHLYDNHGILPANKTSPFYYRRHASAATFAENDPAKLRSLARRDIRALGKCLASGRLKESSQLRLQHAILLRSELSDASLGVLLRSGVPIVEVLRFTKRKATLRLSERRHATTPEIDQDQG